MEKYKNCDYVVIIKNNVPKETEYNKYIGQICKIIEAREKDAELLMNDGEHLLWQYEEFKIFDLQRHQMLEIEAEL